MLSCRTIAVSSLILCCLPAPAKKKHNVILPADVLQARSVLVLIDPDAGTSPDAPMANRTAQDDVERALRNWGRFRLAIDVSDADLIVTVRKGNGKIARPTIGGLPTNNRPVIFQPSDTGGTAGGHKGTPPTPGDPTGGQPQGPAPQVEVGSSEDMFVVYRGQRSDPLDAPPVWRYTAKDALRSPGVPAVDEFRKVIAEAEKQPANQP